MVRNMFNKMNNRLYLFVGPSGSGKTTMADQLELMYDYKSVQSYTTRSQRYAGETGHIFVTDEEFNELTDMVAYTDYNNFRYCATAEQLDECDVYVVDVPGVEYLLEKYNNTDRNIMIFYFDANTKTRVLRMIDRGDSDASIVARLLEDGDDDWYYQLLKLCDKYSSKFKLLDIHKINANKNKKLVWEQVENLMFPFLRK